MRHIYIFLICLPILSCSISKETLSYQRVLSKKSVKVLITDKQKGESLLIGLFIPQKNSIYNSLPKVKINSVRYSLKGGNVYGTNGTEVYSLKNGSLTISNGSFKIVKFKTKEINHFVGYKVFISTSEKEKLLKDAKFIQNKYGGKLFNIGNIETHKIFLSQKIPDSLKGFIHLNFKNPQTNQFDYLNIPVLF